MQHKRVVMLATLSETTNILFNGLNIPIEKVLVEERQSRLELMRRRAKKIGPLRVFGQILFQLLVVPLLSQSSRPRVEEIEREFGLDPTPIDPAKIIRITSVNSEETTTLLRSIDPAIVLVKGTRIIAGKTLDAVPAKFVNIHAGITPRYRGVHGAYWSLVERNPMDCGVTIHFVDTGIDTGSVLAQGRISPTPADNFSTYPFLQMAVGLPLLEQSIYQLLDEKVLPLTNLGRISKLWTHPTLWEYISYRLRDNVK